MPQKYIRRLLFAAFTYVLFLSLAASAAERDAFRVEGVKINAHASDELAAKALGLRNGKQAALRLLLERLCSTRDYDRLPDATTKTLNALVRDFSLVGERFGGGRYLANLTVRFNPPQVRALLRKAGIPFAETQSLPILVLPVYKIHGAELLWDNPNPWFNAWRTVLQDNAQSSQSLLPLMAPRGDLSDLTVISAAQAVRGDSAKLNAIMQKYGVTGVLIPVAAPAAFPVRSGTLNAAATTDKSKAPPAATLNISIFRFVGDLDGVAAPPRPIKFQARANETQTDFLTRAAAQVITNAEETWKSANLLTHGGVQKMQILAPFPDFKTWLTIRRRLNKVASVTTVRISRLSIRDATLALHFRGDPSQLKIAMAQRNLDLSYSNEDSSWILQLR